MSLYRISASRPWFYCLLKRNYFSKMASGERSIKLTETEARLRQLLLDASTYAGALEGGKQPELRFTGGWVRDKLIGTTSHDIDIGIDNMTGFKFGTLLKEYLEQPEIQAFHQHAIGNLAKIEANPDKSKHLETATTKIMGFDLDLVNLRKETYSEESRNPTMEFGTPREDALRRDATVNALFYNLRTNQVEDFTGQGLSDMEDGRIRTPLAPLQTFKDDPLRVLRCIRFASRLGYQIDPEAEVAMSDASIKTALRLKISRERVGVEITKMLKDPNAHRAIVLIDQLNLYNTIFTNPTDSDCKLVATEHWHQAYNTLLAILQGTTETSPEHPDLRILGSNLLRDDYEIFLAWMLVCFVPWAREMPKIAQKSSAKKKQLPAFLAAREGVKADNKLCKVVDAAASHLQEVINLKNSIKTQQDPGDLAPKEERVPVARQVHGRALRAWGSDWRSVIVFALLTEATDLQDPVDIRSLLGDYADWMNTLSSLDLLDVDKLAPLVKGDQLCKALGNVKSGPWLREALDMAMDWQLRNPEGTDPSGAIAEVVAKRKMPPI